MAKQVAVNEELSRNVRVFGLPEEDSEDLEKALHQKWSGIECGQTQLKQLNNFCVCVDKLCFRLEICYSFFISITLHKTE